MIREETTQFIANIQGIDGWLYDDNIHVTAAIFGAMKKFGVRGPNFEIGVYKGKYLSAIHHCACVYHEPTLTVGMDAFMFGTTEQNTRDTWQSLFGSTDGLRIFRANSYETKASQIVEMCDGHKPAFISIDGDHTVWAVLNDHVICADALLRGGVISSDDFSNWQMIGLMDGIARFFLTHNKHGIVPFCFCMNKLYSCHHEFHERYMNAMIEWCDAHKELAPAKRFIHLRDGTGMWAARQELFGNVCLIL